MKPDIQHCFLYCSRCRTSTQALSVAPAASAGEQDAEPATAPSAPTRRHPPASTLARSFSATSLLMLGCSAGRSEPAMAVLRAVRHTEPSSAAAAGADVCARWPLLARCCLGAGSLCVCDWVTRKCAGTCTAVRMAGGTTRAYKRPVAAAVLSPSYMYKPLTAPRAATALQRAATSATHDTRSECALRSQARPHGSHAQVRRHISLGPSLCRPPLQRLPFN
jgi:hypothetical protein